MKAKLSEFAIKNFANGVNEKLAERALAEAAKNGGIIDDIADDILDIGDDIVDDWYGDVVSEGVGSNKIQWDSWQNYEKVTANGQEYAKVGDRLYSKHAVDRTQPSGNRFGPNIYQTGGDYGRSVAPKFVEDVISSVKPTLQPNGNLSYVSGTVEIITNQQGAVVTIMTYR